MSRPFSKALGRGRRAPSWYLVLGAVLAAVIGIALHLWIQERARPVILALDPSIGEPGGVIRVVGRNF
ncbi:MAG TPA: hypothetical protein VLH39_03400, partial [Magnetospirillaceae bacterium]|nr:hypothetical protein [Magnetospirillaceae bacterium]